MQLDLGSLQAPVDPGHQLPVDQLEVRTHLLETVHVPLDGPGPQVVTSRKGNPGLPTSGQQWAQDDDRCPHLADQFDWSFGLGFIGDDDPQLVVSLFDVTADVLQHAGHQLDVENRGDVGQMMPARGEERGDDLFENGVLGTQRTYGSAQARSALDENLGHYGESTWSDRQPLVNGLALQSRYAAARR